MQLDKMHANVENILHMHSEKELAAEQPNTETCCKNYINTKYRNAASRTELACICSTFLYLVRLCAFAVCFILNAAHVLSQ